MQKSVTLFLLIVGLINIAPVLGVLSVHNIEAAYAVSIADNNLGILLRHRALLFGIVGGFVIYSAFVPRYQLPAMVMAGVSMLGYAALVLEAESHNSMLGKVLLADMVGIAFLAAATVLRVIIGRG